MEQIKKLIEQIASEELEKLKESKKRLDLKKFYELNNELHPEKIFDWLIDNGTFLGQGSSRAVFLIDSSKVLKFAYVGSDYDYLPSEVGQEQNKAEVEVYTNPKIKPIVPKIFDFADDYSWIISELVKPLDDEPEEWENLTGLSWSEFQRFLRRNKTWARGQLSDDRIEEIKKLPFIKNVQALMDEEKTQSGDLSELGHWGKTSDGRIVLLDSGLNEEVSMLYW